jgi:YihY family inner membrane protein
VPFLMLVVVALSHFIPEAELLSTLSRYLEWIIPSQSKAVVVELSHFLKDRELVTGVLFLVMLFFSSVAFTALENAMCVIFYHRVAIRRRRFLISAILPYCYIVGLGLGILIVTLVAGTLQVLGEESVHFMGYLWSLGGVSGVLLYLVGLTGEILVLSSIYLVMPVGRLSLSHALIGGVTAALLWEVARHVLVWYFSTLSQVNVVYGSMTTAIVVMFSLEIGAILLLFGAQVISEYERVGRDEQNKEPEPMTTDAPDNLAQDPANDQ